MVKDLEVLRAAEITWFVSWEKSRWRGDLIAVYIFLQAGSRVGDADLLCLVTSNRTQGNLNIPKCIHIID